jgi:hypothetical protein
VCASARQLGGDHRAKTTVGSGDHAGPSGLVGYVARRPIRHTRTLKASCAPPAPWARSGL